MKENDVVLTIQRINPGERRQMEQQYERQRAEREAIADQLAVEGVSTESVFIATIGDDDYLIYYIEADDFDETMETFRQDDSERTEAYKELIEETLEGGRGEYHENRHSPEFHVKLDAKNPSDGSS